MPSDPDDRATHRTRQCDTGQGCDTEEGPWAFQTRKHFGYGTSRKEPGLGPGCNLEIELNHGWGIETRSCSLAAVGTGLSVSLPRMCLGSSRCGEAREAWWEIKGRNKAAS